MKSNANFWTSAQFFQRLDALLEQKGISFNHANGGCYLANLVVDGLKHPRQISHDG